MAFSDFGKWLIVFGAILVILGAVLTLAGKIPWLGNLPGDIYIQRLNFTFYFPLTSLDPPQRGALVLLVSLFPPMIFAARIFGSEDRRMKCMVTWLMLRPARSWRILCLREPRKGPLKPWRPGRAGTVLQGER